jgi:hypothetical protein
LELLDRMNPTIEELTAAAEQEARKRPEVLRLMTHPGVGPLTALAYVSQKQVSGFIANGGSAVSRASVEDYRGGVFGISIIKSPSLDDAVRLAEGWPELQYRGRLDILKQL